MHYINGIDNQVLSPLVEIVSSKQFQPMRTTPESNAFTAT